VWDEIIAQVPEYPSAVATARDEEGYPFSFRCHPSPDASSQVLRLRVPPGAPVRPGPANLLCHKHDEWLWHQRSFLVRGTLERDSEEWLLRPISYLPGVGYGGVRGQMRFVLGARRAAHRYLRSRGLPRPKVPWDLLAKVKRQAFVNLAATRSLRAPVVDAPPPRRVDVPVAVLSAGRPVTPLVTRQRARVLLPAVAVVILALVIVALWWRGRR
jgi:hypothetical protein